MKKWEEGCVVYIVGISSDFAILSPVTSRQTSFCVPNIKLSSNVYDIDQHNRWCV